jgi:hypothetical protein
VVLSLLRKKSLTKSWNGQEERVGGERAQAAGGILKRDPSTLTPRFESEVRGCRKRRNGNSKTRIQGWGACCFC